MALTLYHTTTYVAHEFPAWAWEKMEAALGEWTRLTGTIEARLDPDDYSLGELRSSLPRRHALIPPC